MEHCKSNYDFFKLYDTVKLLEPQLKTEIKEVKKLEKAILKPAVINQNQSSEEFNRLFERLNYMIDKRKGLLKEWKKVSSKMKKINDFLPYSNKLTHQYSDSNSQQLGPLCIEIILLTYKLSIILRVGYEELAREREICIQLREYLGITKS